MLGLKEHELFATPKNMQAVVDWIEGHDSDSRPHIYTAMFMTLNVVKDIAEKVEVPVQTALQHLRDDMVMLQNGDWMPDKSSVEATLDNIKLIAEKLDIKLEEESEG